MLSPKTGLLFLGLFTGSFLFWMQGASATGTPDIQPRVPASLTTDNPLRTPSVAPIAHKRRSAALLVGTATLSWIPNAERDLAGYKVYYGTGSRTYGRPVDIGNATTFTVRNLAVGATYYFAVTAYDTAGRESGFSNEVSQTIP